MCSIFKLAHISIKCSRFGIAHLERGPVYPLLSCLCCRYLQTDAASADSVLERYRHLVTVGKLTADSQQSAVVERLDALYGQLLQYNTAVQAYNDAVKTYQAARQELLRQLQSEFKHEARHEATAQADPPGLWETIRRAVLGDEAAQHSSHATQHADKEELLRQRLGPPPPPPTQPRGVYIWGSVGSGKSLVMDMLYATAAQQQQVPYTHRLHFNSAMILIHSHLHKLDQQRLATESAAAAKYAQKLQQFQLSPPAELSAHTDAHRRYIRTLLRQDPGYHQQKRSRLARLSFRRYLRDKLSRNTQQNSTALARSNSDALRQAATQIIAPSAVGGTMDCLPAGGRVSALLCFDEMQVGDAFNAVALKGVLESLMSLGAVVVFTSNKPPWELNRHGLHEDLFDHFVDFICKHCDVLELSAQHDYRRLMAAQQRWDGIHAASANYFYPLGPESDAALESRWRAVCHQQGAQRTEHTLTLPVAFGRNIEVPRACGGAAFFNFEDLCNRFVGTADYIALASTFHTLFLRGMPAMSLKIKDQARRFILLVDELYNARVKLVASSACPLDEIFSQTQDEEPIIDLEELQFETAVEGSKLRRDLMADGGVAPVAATPQSSRAAHAQLGGAEEKFMFRRAVSRLHEMQSDVYLQSRRRSA